MFYTNLYKPFKMKKTLLILAVTLLLQYGPATCLSAQNTFRAMSYNVENLFDIDDDSLTRDEEYLPGGIRGWSYTRFRQKIINIGRVLVAGGWTPPAIAGLCEIESRKAMTELTRYSTLKNLGYRFIHYESPDARGVDVAFLYLPEFFRPISHKPVSIFFPHAPASHTRDLLYVSGLVPTGDTLHCFVCHFPSRLGGELESEQNRIFVASVLRKEVDSLFNENVNSNILIMGDFNDYPDNRSMSETLGAVQAESETGDLVNLMYPLHRSGKGTHKHAGEWGALDQLIVSRSLLKPGNRIRTSAEGATILNLPFLQEEDTRYLGLQPFRTYAGMKYQGGYSDHLPVYIDFYY